jgi:hypothetical protein
MCTVIEVWRSTVRDFTGYLTSNVVTDDGKPCVQRRSPKQTQYLECPSYVCHTFNKLFPVSPLSTRPSLNTAPSMFYRRTPPDPRWSYHPKIQIPKTRVRLAQSVRNAHLLTKTAGNTLAIKRPDLPLPSFHSFPWSTVGLAVGQRIASVPIIVSHECPSDPFMYSEIGRVPSVYICWALSSVSFCAFYVPPYQHQSANMRQ